MTGIAELLVALWGILHRMVILCFRNFIAVEDEGTRRRTTMCYAIGRHRSGVEEPAGEGFSLSPFSPCLLRSYLQHVRFAVEAMRNFA